MNAFLSLGRWFFAVPFAIFGIMHFLNAQGMAENVVPTYMPAREIFVYIGGAGLIAAAVSMVSGKYDKLAAILLAIYLLILIVSVHLPAALDTVNNYARSQAATFNLLKDLSLAGAAMLYAKYQAVDRSVVG